MVEVLERVIPRGRSVHNNSEHSFQLTGMIIQYCSFSDLLHHNRRGMRFGRRPQHMLKFPHESVFLPVFAETLTLALANSQTLYDTCKEASPRAAARCIWLKTPAERIGNRPD